MAIKIHTYLPGSGDSTRLLDHKATAKNGARGVAASRVDTGSTSRPATFDYLTQVCLASEAMGADSILVPVGATCEDPWVTASALIPRTTSLKFMVAFRPGLVTPVIAAQMMSSFQRFSGGRLTLNVTPGLPGHVSNRYGDWNSKEQRLAQAGEFLTIMRGAWGAEPFDFEGEYFKVKGASVARPDPLPPVFYGGSSEASMRFAAEYADVYLSYVEPPDMAGERLGRVREMAAALGRDIRCALSFRVISRATSDEAWEAARESLHGVDEEMIRTSFEVFNSTGYGQSGARQRLLGQLKGDVTDAVISPNLWVAPMLVRAGIAPALVGSYEEIADRIEELVAVGTDEFQIAGLPTVEEYFRFGEHVMPILRARGLLAEPVGAAAR